MFQTCALLVVTNEVSVEV